MKDVDWLDDGDDDVIDLLENEIGLGCNVTTKFGASFINHSTPRSFGQINHHSSLTGEKSLAVNGK